MIETRLLLWYSNKQSPNYLHPALHLDKDLMRNLSKMDECLDFAFHEILSMK